MPIIPCPALLSTHTAFILAQLSRPVLSPTHPFACLPLACLLLAFALPHACPPLSSTCPCLSCSPLASPPTLSSFLLLPCPPILGSDQSQVSTAGGKKKKISHIHQCDHDTTTRLNNHRIATSIASHCAATMTAPACRIHNSLCTSITCFLLPNEYMFFSVTLLLCLLLSKSLKCVIYSCITNMTIGTAESQFDYNDIPT